MSDWSELFPEQKTVMFGDIEVPLSHKPRLRDLPPITADEVRAHTAPREPLKPRPVITAWEGADMDAYWLDGETWRHCQTGEPWSPSLQDVADRVCEDILFSNLNGAAA